MVGRHMPSQRTKARVMSGPPANAAVQPNRSAAAPMGRAPTNIIAPPMLQTLNTLPYSGHGTVIWSTVETMET